MDGNRAATIFFCYLLLIASPYQLKASNPRKQNDEKEHTFPIRGCLRAMNESIKKNPRNKEFDLFLLFDAKCNMGAARDVLECAKQLAGPQHRTCDFNLTDIFLHIQHCLLPISAFLAPFACKMHKLLDAARNDRCTALCIGWRMNSISPLSINAH